MELFKYREELNIEFFYHVRQSKVYLCILNSPQLQTLYIFSNCWNEFNVSANQHVVVGLNSLQMVITHKNPNIRGPQIH